jgi:hypothetical protein
MFVPQCRLPAPPTRRPIKCQRRIRDHKNWHCIGAPALGRDPLEDGQFHVLKSNKETRDQPIRLGRDNRRTRDRYHHRANAEAVLIPDNITDPIGFDDRKRSADGGQVAAHGRRVAGFDQRFSAQIDVADVREYANCHHDRRAHKANDHNLQMAPSVRVMHGMSHNDPPIILIKMLKGRNQGLNRAEV